MLQSLGGEINWAMWVLIEGSNFILNFGPILLLAVGILSVVYYQWRKTPKGRLNSDSLLLRLPLLGRIFLDSELFQITSLVGTLVGSDINMTETLRLTERTIQNRSIRARFRVARTQVNEGLSLSQAFRRNGIMPDLSLDILSVGENTGNIANSLREMSLQFRRDLDARLRFMTTAITSGAMVIAFLLVALVAFGMVSSIFQVSKSL
jgi:type II secretory pathway component PulF